MRAVELGERARRLARNASAMSRICSDPPLLGKRRERQRHVMQMFVAKID